MRALRRWRAGALPFILCALLSIGAGAYWRGDSTMLVEAAAVAQDNTMLERRISQLDQRFYTVETRLNHLEQQASLSERPSVPQVGGRDADVTLLRAEVETLQRRLAEIECGLVKVDERTLGAAARDARRKSRASATDPCRLNPENSVQLSARP